MKLRIFGIALAFLSLWAFAFIVSSEYEIRSLPYELGFPLFFMGLAVPVAGMFAGLALTLGLLVRKDAA